MRQRKLRQTYQIAQDHYHSYGGNLHEKSDRALRIYSQNINGLTYTQKGEDYDYVHGTLDTMNIDVAGLSETNSPWTNHHLTDGYTSAVNRYAGISKTHFSSASVKIDPIKPTTYHQSGGTASTVYGGWTTRIRQSTINDPTGLGRWSGVILGGKQNKKLAIITGYRVCDQSRTAAGENTSYAREWEYFRDQGIESPNPRQQFLTDLQSQILKLKNHDIIVMLDANEIIGTKNMSAFVKSSNLHDLHTNAPAATTCHSSTQGRIDYIFGTLAVAASMLQSGTLSYAEGLTSDHRGLFVDIDYVKLLQLDTINQIMPSAGRTLKSGNPEMTDKYISVVTEYFEQHQMVERLDNLILHRKRYPKTRLRRLLNQLDDDMGRAMKAGEQSLRQTIQKFQFSPTLRKFGLQLQYWRTRFKDHFNESTSDRTIQTIEDEIRRYNNDYQLPQRDQELTIDEIRKGFTAATKALKLAQKAAGPLRYKFQLELVEKYRDEGDLKRMRIVERTIQAEHSRAMHRKIGSDMKPLQRSSVSQLTIPHHPDQDWDALLTSHEIIKSVPEDSIVWEHVFDQETIEEVLLEYNRQSFRKAAESPLGSGFIYDALKFSSLSKAGSEILSGKIPDSWNITDPRLTAFLTSFAIPDNVKSSPPIQTTISEDDFVYGIKGWKEKTSTSPSGRHLGHYKAIIEDPTLLTFNVKFLNLLVSTGLSLERWQNAINVLIAKDPGEPRLHRLRIIHLFEADYNFILKLLWGSRLVRKGEKSKQLNNNQHGSRHDRQGLDPVHLQLISMDLCRILKLDMASFDNDASACYDRIIVSLGMLAARRLGMPENAIRCHSQALMLMKYAVKTIYGISDQTYQGTPFEPLFGTGQGSGASPAVWLTLVVVLLNTLDQLISSRMVFKSPDFKQLHSRLADAFVDDTSMGFTSPGELTYASMIKELQHIAQTWEKLLHFSGGALNLKKCHWWLMYWEWIDGRPKLRPHRPDDPTIHLHQGRDPILHPIKHSDVTKANRILGVFLAPNGNFQTQIDILREKAQQYSNRLRKSRLTPSEAYTFYRTTYIPAMTYTLPALACDEEELQEVQSAVLPALLNQMGVHSKYPTALRHGPTEHAGLDLIDLKTESGIYLLKSLRDSVFSDKEHGRMMLTAIKTSQLESGLSTDILMHPSTPVSYMTPTWITTIRQYLYNHGMSVELTDQLDMTASCANDQLLMDPARIKQYTTDEQLDINLARIHTQSIWLSDLTTGDGLRIRPACLNGKKDNERQSTYEWPRQPLLTTKQCNRWKRYLTEQFTLSDGYSLKRPLGEWIHTNRNQWRYTTLHDRLYDHQHLLSSFQQSKQRRSSTYGNWTTKHYKSSDDQHQPTTITHQTAHSTTILHRKIRPTSPPATPPHKQPSIKSYIQSLPPTERRLLQTYNQSADDNTIWRTMRSKRLLTIATDGGLKTHRGTYGWKIVTSNDIVLFSGAGPVDGDHNSESSTRSELYGIAAPVLLLASLHRFWGTTHRSKYQWLCDSGSALKQVRQLQYHATRKRKQPNNVDILSLLASQLPALGHRLEGKWVKAHQDDDLPYEELSRAARLNVDVDKLATWYRDHATLPQSRQQTPHAPGTSVSIKIGDTRLVGNFDSSIRRHINGYHSKQFMQAKLDWDDATFATVDWHNFGQHFKALPLTARVQRSKLVHRWQPVGTQRLRDATIKDPHLALCPSCQTEIETPDHLFLCERRQGLRHRLLQSVTKITHRAPYHPALVILTNGIEQWLAMEPITIQAQVQALPQHIQDGVSKAIYEQFDIGWNNAIRGLLSSQWAQSAATHHITGDYEIDTGNGHVYRTIRAIHNFTSAIWEARNQQLHKRDDELAARIRTPIDALIKSLYQQPHLLHSTDRFRTATPLATILNYRPDNKRRWVRRVERAQARYIDIQKRRQVALVQYPGYTFKPRKRPPIPASPTQTIHFKQTTLFGTKPAHKTTKRAAKMPTGKTQPQQRQTLIHPLQAPQIPHCK